MKTALINIVNGLIPHSVTLTPCLPPLTRQIEQARHEWISAQNYYNNVSDADLVDYATYLVHAAEKKYIYLLKRARHEGVHDSSFN